MDDEKLRKIVNSSGFPLQIRLEHLVKSNDELGWKVLTKEHSWSNEKGPGGFIDLVLEKPTYRTLLTVECKRVRETSWIFLHEEHSAPKRRHFKAWMSYGSNLSREVNGWVETQVYPESPESQFCVVDGQDNKSKPMLERVAAELVNATEAFSDRDSTIHLPEQEYVRIVIPIIITTAELRICKFNFENVSLGTGEIDKSTFDVVPFLRFRKQFTDRHIDQDYSKPISYRDIDKGKENSVFIVNSEHVLDFLWTSQGLLDTKKL